MPRGHGSPRLTTVGEPPRTVAIEVPLVSGTATPPGTYRHSKHYRLAALANEPDPHVPSRRWCTTACTCCQAMLRRRKPRRFAEQDLRSIPRVRCQNPCAIERHPRASQYKAKRGRSDLHKRASTSQSPPVTICWIQMRRAVRICTGTSAAHCSMLIAVLLPEVVLVACGTQAKVCDGHLIRGDPAGRCLGHTLVGARIRLARYGGRANS